MKSLNNKFRSRVIWEGVKCMHCGSYVKLCVNILRIDRCTKAYVPRICDNWYIPLIRTHHCLSKWGSCIRLKRPPPHLLVTRYATEDYKGALDDRGRLVLILSKSIYWPCEETFDGDRWVRMCRLDRESQGRSAYHVWWEVGRPLLVSREEIFVVP